VVRTLHVGRSRDNNGVTPVRLGLHGGKRREESGREWEGNNASSTSGWLESDTVEADMAHGVHTVATA
jgi:hypothetical protein